MESIKKTQNENRPEYSIDGEKVDYSIPFLVPYPQNIKSSGGIEMTLSFVHWDEKVKELVPYYRPKNTNLFYELFCLPKNDNLKR